MNGDHFRLFIASTLLLFFCKSHFALAYSFEDRSQFSFENLTNLIENKSAELQKITGKTGPLTSVEETLAALKKVHPRIFNKYILMYRSQSLQRASFLEPRAILFDNSGQLVITFNGISSDKAGFNKLEIMQFRENEHRFEFREISFDSVSGPKISEANPSKCLGCHQSQGRKSVDPRPNWEPYNTWPGAYGSANGKIGRLSKSDALFNRLIPGDEIYLSEQALEEPMLTKFMSQVQPGHPRYGFLNVDFDTPTAMKDAIGRFTKEFTNSLQNLNLRRIFRLMIYDHASLWAYLKPVVLGVAKCDRLFISEVDRKWHDQNLPAEFIERREEKNEQDHWWRRTTDLTRKHQHLGLKYHEARKRAEVDVEREKILQRQYPHLSWSKGLWTLFTPLGVSISDWSMDFQTEGRLAFSERLGGPGSQSEYLRYAAGKFGIDLANLNCESLKEQSLRSYSRFRQSQLFNRTLEEKRTSQSQQKPLIDKCIFCHVQEAEYSLIPEIPFDKPFQLKRLLESKNLEGVSLLDDIRFRLSDYAPLEKQMPRGIGRPSRKDREELLEYLESL